MRPALRLDSGESLLAKVFVLALQMHSKERRTHAITDEKAVDLLLGKQAVDALTFTWSSPSRKIVNAAV
jgi:hypothetical protein